MRLLVYFFVIQMTLIVTSQCKKVRDASVEKILLHYQNSAFDSLDASLTEWSARCELNEELFRLAILNAIYKRESIDPWMNKHVMGHMRAYETGAIASMAPYFHSTTYADSLADILNKMTVGWANNLSSDRKIEALFLTVYRTRSAAPFWNTLISGDFPNEVVQGSFNAIPNATKGNQDLLVFRGGVFAHQSSKSITPQIGFSYDRLSPSVIQSAGLAVRFNGPKEMTLTYKDIEDTIATNGIYVYYDYGMRIRKASVDYVLFGTLSHMLFLSEYGFVSDRKRIVSAVNVGVGAGMHFKSQRLSKLGVEVRYNPVNFITNKEVEMDLSTVSLNLKFMLRTSRVAREFLKPIGYYK